VNVPATGLDGVTLPRHIAIIMDGNGRWAERRGLPRRSGHEEGAKSVREVTRECARLGIGQLTLYSFSRENWKRPPAEVAFLMRLLKRYLVKERREIMDNRIRFAAIGRLAELPKDVQAEIAYLRETSANNGGMILCLALNYGGRTEIVDAARAFARDVAAGRTRIDDLTEETFTRYLYDPRMPDPDLIIRTAGELRLSNFLLWESSYAELYVTPVHWPEFRREQLHEALRAYGARQRRFGAIPDKPSTPPAGLR
jgi:undecaprenyl diphosphate synthase